jgi:hypothetical protein
MEGLRRLLGLDHLDVDFIPDVQLDRSAEKLFTMSVILARNKDLVSEILGIVLRRRPDDAGRTCWIFLDYEACTT